MNFLQQQFFNHFPRLEKDKNSTGLRTPCMALYYTCSLVGMRITVSLLSFSKIKLRISSTHSFWTLTALFAEILRKRTN
jgi:hypothetical protein